MTAGSRLAHLFGPAAEPKAVEPGTSKRVAEIRPHLSRRGIPAAAVPASEDVRPADPAATEEEPGPPRPEPTHSEQSKRERDVEPSITVIAIDNAVPSHLDQPQRPSIATGDDRGRPVPLSPAPTIPMPDRPEAPREARPIEPSPSMPLPRSSPAPAAASGGPAASRDERAPAPAAPPVQPPADSRNSTTQRDGSALESPRPRQTVTAPPPQPPVQRVEHVVKVLTPREEGLRDTAIEPPRPPAAATSAHRSPAARETKPGEEATREPPSRAAMETQVAQKDNARPHVIVTPAPPLGASVPKVATKAAETSHGVSIRIGRVDIVATPPKTAAPRGQKRSARVTRAARPHQIDPRWPIPPGRW